MPEPELLMIPGPVTVSSEVLERMAVQMFNHRGPRYAKLLSEVCGGVSWLLGTKGETHAITGSGTAGLEFAQVNCVHPKDRVLCLSNGVFGERLADIASVFGKEVQVLEKPYGEAILPEDVEKELGKGKFEVVTCVFNESSTGVRNPVREIGEKVRDSGALFLVDNVSGLGMEYLMDDWGVDVTVTATQKALGIPPGLSFVAMSERAREKALASPNRSYYFRYKTYVDYAKKGQPPFTPCISGMVATAHVLSKIRKNGLKAFNSLHSRRGVAVRAASEDLGLKLFAQEGYRSDTLTSLQDPRSEEIRKFLREKRGVIVGGGQKHLAGKVFRIGHMGDIRREDFARTFKAIGDYISTTGGKPDSERALGEFEVLGE